MADQTKAAKEKESKSVGREYLEAFLIAMVFLSFTNTFVVQTFYIPSSSMENTLLVGDHLFVNRFIYGPTATGIGDRVLPARPVERGDIVIFRSPENPRLDLVKRCIGIPGDTIEVLDKQLYVNGRAVDDASYAIHRDPVLFQERAFYRQTKRDNFGPLTVPEGHYFCMGDNRDNSNDSRFWGTVPSHMVKGRALFIYWSFGGETSDGTWRGVGNKLVQLGKTAVGFFTKTRWDRTFKLIR